MIWTCRRGGAMRLAFRLIPALLLVAGGVHADADTWTNTAGYALEAMPVEFDGSKVTFLRPSGEKLEMPLYSFLPAEQKRLKEFLGILEVPGPLKSAYRLAETQLATAQALYAEGRIDEHEHARRRDEVIQTFLKMCESQSYPRDSAEVQKLMRQL